MNKTQLIDVVAKNANLKKKDAELAVTAALDAITAALDAYPASNKRDAKSKPSAEVEQAP